MAVKKATVFIDKFSKENLEKQGINVREIFRLAGEKFLKQGIPLGYDLDGLQIEYLPFEHKRRWFEKILFFFLLEYLWSLFTLV